MRLVHQADRLPGEIAAARREARASFGDDTLLEIGEAAAWNAWEGGEGPVDLCCGFAGRAYALLEVHRRTSDPVWLHRAEALAERAVAVAPQMQTAEHPRHSLYKGELGLALLIADLDHPSAATMPMFGQETDFGNPRCCTTVA